jgi:nuclease S1
MRLCLALLGIVMLCSQARAWGAPGHRIVAELAERYVTAKTRRELGLLLEPGQHLADVSNWADDYRKRCSTTGPWHYVNIPIDAPRYDAARDCPEPPSCVVRAAERSLAILADDRQSAEDRSFALRLAVHFIGDLHQPLHSGDRGDKGGNALRVSFAGRTSNLHAVWDYELIAWTKRSVADYVDLLARSLTNSEARRFRRGTVRDWTEEAHRAARSVYAKLPAAGDRAGPLELDDSYGAAVLPLLDEQLLRAGVRLAAALDSALAKPGKRLSESQLTAARACAAPEPKPD